MKTLQDYIDQYENIASGLGYMGDSVDILVQLLANATYIDEVENMSYVQEASLERSVLLNSKIQHCVDRMYSVYRGSCPRVLIKLKPSKKFSFKKFDKLVTGNRFNIYYTGYYRAIDKEISEEKTIENLDTLETSDTENLVFGVNNSGITINPSSDSSYIIEGLIASDVVTGSKTLDYTNTYYINVLDNDLSNDMYVVVNPDTSDTRITPTRNFSEHILDNKIFDLTLPGFGSRLYVTGYPENTTLSYTYFVYSELSSYNESDLEQINISGATLESFNTNWLEKKGFDSTYSDLGLTYISEVGRDNLETIHYKANRDRYVNSIFRSNSDIGTVFEETFPGEVKSGGTSYIFNTSSSTSGLTIYYIPKGNSIIDNTKINEFIKNRKAYYVTTKDISVKKGKQLKAVLDINIELYKASSEDIGETIDEEIKNNYQDKFGIIFNDSVVNDIRALISKYSNVKQVSSISLKLEDPDKSDSIITIDQNTGFIKNSRDTSDYANPMAYYFKVITNITTTIRR